MEMIGHQAEGKHPDRELSFRDAEQVEKCFVVSLLVKDDRAAVAAINDMKDRTGRLFAAGATHRNDVTLRGEERTKMMSDTFSLLLCWAMENLAEGRVVNQISVPEDEKHWARIALQRMLDVSVPS
jgi:quinolinate synthase